MRSTSIRLTEPLHDALEAHPENTSQLIREALTEKALNHMIGKCAITGETLYTFTPYMEVKPDTPLGNTLGITDINTALIKDKNARPIVNAIASGNTDNIEQTPDYYNRIGADIYAIERAYLNTINMANTDCFEWAKQQLLNKTLEEPDTDRIISLLKWVVFTDGKHVDIENPVETIWMNASNDVKEDIEMIAEDDSQLEQVLSESDAITYPIDGKINN
jgi:hypothetical protein